MPINRDAHSAAVERLRYAAELTKRAQEAKVRERRIERAAKSIAALLADVELYEAAAAAVTQLKSDLPALIGPAPVGDPDALIRETDLQLREGVSANSMARRWTQLGFCTVTPLMAQSLQRCRAVIRQQRSLYRRRMGMAPVIEPCGPLTGS